MSERFSQSNQTFEALPPAEQLDALRKEAFDFLTDEVGVAEETAEERLRNSMDFYRNNDPSGDDPRTLQRFSEILSNIKAEQKNDTASQSTDVAPLPSEVLEESAPVLEFDGDPRHLTEELFSSVLAHNDPEQLHVHNLLELMFARHNAIKSFLSSAKLSFQAAAEEGVEVDGYSTEDYQRDYAHLKRFLTKLEKRDDEQTGSYERIDPQHAKLLFMVWERLFSKSDALMEVLQIRSEQSPAAVRQEISEEKGVDEEASAQSEAVVRFATYADIERLAAKLNHVPLEFQTYFASVLGRMNLLLRDIERESVDPAVKKERQREFSELALQFESEVSEFAPKKEADEAETRELVAAVEAEDVPDGERVKRPGGVDSEPAVIDAESVSLEANEIASGVSNETTDLEYKKIYGQWEETRKEADEMSKLYSEKLKQYYESYYKPKAEDSIFSRTKQKWWVSGKEFFGIKPSLTPELREMRDREESLQAQYAALGGRLIEQRKNEERLTDARKYSVISKEEYIDTDSQKKEREVGKVVDMSVVERYQRMLERKLALKPIQERIEMQKTALEGMPHNKTFNAMRETMRKNRYALLAGKVVVYGTVGAVTGGVAAGSLAALRVGAGFAGGVAGGTIGHRAMQRSVNRADEISRSLMEKRMSALSAEELRNRRAELIEAFSIKDRRLRQQKYAALVGAAIGGGTAARFGPELYDAAADTIHDAHQKHLFMRTNNDPYGSLARSPEDTRVPIHSNELGGYPDAAETVPLPETFIKPELPTNDVLDTEHAPVIPEDVPEAMPLPEGEPRSELPVTEGQGPFEYGDEQAGVILQPHQELVIPEYEPDQNPPWADMEALAEPATEGAVVAPEVSTAVPEEAVAPVDTITAEELREAFDAAEPRTPLDYSSAERIENQEHLLRIGEHYGKGTVSEQVYESWKDGAFEHLQWVPGPDEISKQEFLDRMNELIDPNSSIALSPEEIQAMDIESGDFSNMPHGDQYDAVPLLDKMFPPDDISHVESVSPDSVQEHTPYAERSGDRIGVGTYGEGESLPETTSPESAPAGSGALAHFNVLTSETVITTEVFYDPVFHLEVVEFINESVDGLWGVNTDEVLHELEARAFSVEGSVANVGEIHELVRGIVSREHVLNQFAPHGNDPQMSAFEEFVSTDFNGDISRQLETLIRTGYDAERLMVLLETVAEHSESNPEGLSSTLAENIETLFRDGTFDFTPDHKGIVTLDGKLVFKLTS